MKKILVIIVCLVPLFIFSNGDLEANMGGAATLKADSGITSLDDWDVGRCSYKGIVLKGKVKVVDSFADLKIRFVDSYPGMKITN